MYGIAGQYILEVAGSDTGLAGSGRAGKPSLQALERGWDGNLIESSGHLATASTWYHIIDCKSTLRA